MTLGLVYKAPPGAAWRFEQWFAAELRAGRNPAAMGPRPVSVPIRPVANELVSTGRARGEKNPQMRERQQ